MQSIWEKEFIHKNTDLTIVGAGFSGLWTAFFLKKNNPRCTIQILEKESFPLGASTRNAGFACFGSPGELLMNFETLGKEKALHWAVERWKGIQLIKKYFGDKVDYQNCGGFELFSDDKTTEMCEFVLPELNAFFAERSKNIKTYQLAHKTIDHFGFRSYNKAILNTEEGSLNSGKLLSELTNHLLTSGVRIIRDVNYKNHNESSNGVVIETSVGELKTTHLCFATNAFSPKKFKITPGRGQVLLTKPIKDLRLDGTFHIDKGYTYFRNIGNRVLIGGGRNLAMDEEATHQYAVTETIQNYLEKLLRERILPGQNFEIESRWAGIMGFTETHEPICEVQSPHVSVIAGMNGMGVALAPRLGEVLAGEILNL